MAQEHLDKENFAPYLLEIITHKIGTNASQLYQREFNIGLGEWRVLSMLALEKETTAKRISELSCIDQGAVSRNIFSLKNKGLISTETNPNDRRQRALKMTTAGEKLHNKVLKQALIEESKLLTDLDQNERQQLVALLQKVYQRVMQSGTP